MRKTLFKFVGLIAVFGGAYGAYTALKPPFWDTGSPLQATESVNLLDDFEATGTGKGWKERTFFRINPAIYEITQEDDARALRCATDNSGSILARDMDIALSDLPTLSWQWKVTQPIDSNFDEDEQAGDDHPVRFYLRFSNDTGETKGAEIIWSNKKYAPGEYKIIGTFYHLVANGLNENVGAWHDQTVDLRQLYSDIGGTGAARLQVLGFFCDSDNTGASSEGFFRRITLTVE